MAKRKRQTNRKVVVRYIGRRPDDPVELLEAIEEVFRPRDIKIEVECLGAPPADTIANEQLETAVREHVAEQLDTKDASTETAAQQDPAQTDSSKRTIRQWVRDKSLAGWRIVAAITPVIEKLKKIFDL